MKQLIYAIPSPKMDSIGLGMNLTYDGYESYSRLASVIVDSIDVQDMKDKMSRQGTPFFNAIENYIDNKFYHPENVYTELFKALGDRTQPEYWVTVEALDASSSTYYKMMEANRASLKLQIIELINSFIDIPMAVDFLKLAGLEDLNLSENQLKVLQSKLDHKNGGIQVWEFLKDKLSKPYLNAYLNVEGKRQYEIIKGSFFSKLMQKLQRRFAETVLTFDKNLQQLPILQNKPKPKDFTFVQLAGFKSKDGEGTMYDNYDERQFLITTYQAWKQQNIIAMPILADTPNLIGVRYKLPEGDKINALAKLVHLEYNRDPENYGLKNYRPEERSIWGNIQYHDDMLKQELAVSKYFDKVIADYTTYAKSKFAYPTHDNAEESVMQYILTYALIHTQMAMITIGDLAFYKNLEDYYRRAKEIWNPVVKGNVDNFFMYGNQKIEVVSKIQKVRVLKTEESPSTQLKELEQITGILLDHYRSIDKTNSQTYIDLIAYRDRMITLNEWTVIHQEAFEQLNKGEIPQNSLGLFNVLKPFYYNLRTVEGITVPTQKKDSELLILPVYGLERIKGKTNSLYNPKWKFYLELMGYNFETMAYDMDKRQYDVITYDTTIKVGQNDELYFDLSDWGKQQETPGQHYMSDAIFGTQLMKLIISNLVGVYNVSGQNISANGLWRRYNNLVVEWINENYNKFVVHYESIENVKKMIIEDMINKGTRDDHIRSIESLPLTHPIHLNKVIQIINSFAKRKVINLRFEKGYTFANASSDGFKNQPKIVWNNNNPKDGIDHFEAYVPIYDIRINDYVDEGIVNMERLHEDIKNGVIPDLLSGLVYRIPTEGKNLIFKIKIIGFLPVDNGVIFMSDMVTKIAGLSFKIDKLSGFFIGGSASHDEVLQVMMAVLSSPQSLLEQVTPRGFEKFNANNLTIRSHKLGGGSKEEPEHILKELTKNNLDFFSPVTLSKTFRCLNVDKVIVGRIANYNAVHSLIEAYSNNTGNYLNDEIIVTYNGQVLKNLCSRLDADNSLVSNNIAQLFAAFLNYHNPMTLYAVYRNLNKDTIIVALYLLAKGLPLKAVQFFLSLISMEAFKEGDSLAFNISFEDLENDIKKGGNTEKYNAMYRNLIPFARKLEQFVLGIQVSNAGAGPHFVDNYFKINRVREALQMSNKMLSATSSLLSGKSVPCLTITEALINKGLIEWNRYIIDKFSFPDLETGTLGYVFDKLYNQILVKPTNADAKSIYSSFTTYITSGFHFFKYATHILKDIHEDLYSYKILYPENKFLQRLVKKYDKTSNSEYIEFIGANSNDELEIQGLIDHWDFLLNEGAYVGVSESQSIKTRNFANALVKYAFYTRGFEFGKDSFGHLIPTGFFRNLEGFNTYFIEELKKLSQKSVEVGDAFVVQYLKNNYRTVTLPFVNGVLNGDVFIASKHPFVGDQPVQFIRYQSVIYQNIEGKTYRPLKMRSVYKGSTNKKLRQWYDYDPI